VRLKSRLEPLSISVEAGLPSLKAPLRQKPVGGYSVKGKCATRIEPEIFIAVLRENNGALLRRLLQTLDGDKSLDARRLARCLIQQTELRDLIPYHQRLLASHHPAKAKRSNGGDRVT
jgi:hypothetical protein